MQRIALLLLAATVVLSGCGASNDQSVKARQAEAKLVTRWKWEPNSAAATPKGFIIEQAGDNIEASFVYLKEGPGFVVDKKISRGRYLAADQKIIFPPAMMTSEELDIAIRMDVGRVEASFTPDANVLHARWTGQGVPGLNMDFVRVKD